MLVSGGQFVIFVIIVIFPLNSPYQNTVLTLTVITFDLYHSFGNIVVQRESGFCTTNVPQILYIAATHENRKQAMLQPMLH